MRETGTGAFTCVDKKADELYTPKSKSEREGVIMCEYNYKLNWFPILKLRALW